MDRINLAEFYIPRLLIITEVDQNLVISKTDKKNIKKGLNEAKNGITDPNTSSWTSIIPGEIIKELTSSYLQLHSFFSWVMTGCGHQRNRIPFQPKFHFKFPTFIKIKTYI
jgi:hypothetical protein